MPVINSEKWILYRHTRSWEIIHEIALILSSETKSFSDEDKKRFSNELTLKGLYKARNPELKLDALNHRINTLAYFLFGYKKKQGQSNSFLFSPLGNKMLEFYEDEQKRALIFVAQLFGIQFPHPHGGTPENFKIFPYRLIFKLLSDSRLGYKLYGFEYAMCVCKVSFIDSNLYESLVNRIVLLRSISDEKLESEFKKDIHTHVNAYYEWSYYQSKFLESAGVLDRFETKEIFKAKHGKSTIRTITNDYIRIAENVKDLVKELLLEYSPFDDVIELNDSERNTEDIVAEIYSFYPNALSKALGEDSTLIEEIKNLINSTIFHSRNPQSGSPRQFEICVAELMNNFIDINAYEHGGAGKTDIECYHRTTNHKFAIDTKSSNTKLSDINTSRLTHHRSLIGAVYTIVIAPFFSRAAINDVKNQETYIVSIHTLTEYIYNEFVRANGRELTYYEIYDFIRNQGPALTDLSPFIQQLTFQRNGISV